MAVFKVELAGRWSEDEGWVEMAGVSDGNEHGSGSATGDTGEGSDEEDSMDA